MVAYKKREMKLKGTGYGKLTENPGTISQDEVDKVKTWDGYEGIPKEEGHLTLRDAKDSDFKHKFELYPPEKESDSKESVSYGKE